MTVFEGFESLSGSPLVPDTLSSWTLSNSANLSMSGSSSHVTEGVQSYRVNGTVSSGTGWQISISDIGAQIPTNTATLFLDVYVDTNANFSVQLYTSLGETTASDSTTTAATGAFQLEVDLSVYGGDITGVFLSITINGLADADSVDVYMDRLANDAGGASVGSGLITGLKLNRMSLV